MERDPGVARGKAAGGAALSGPPDAALLDIVAGLVRESRPAGGAAPAPHLDSSLERDLGISSTVAGVLTSLPVLCFGAVAFSAPPITAVLGGSSNSTG